MRQLVAILIHPLTFILAVFVQVSAQTPVMVQDINPNGDGFADYITGAGSNVFFRATNASFGTELWKYDGNTALVVDINLGVTGSDPVNLIELGSNLVFTANNSTNGRELWKHNGDTAIILRDIYPGSSSSSPEELTIYNGDLYFRAKDGSHGSELWKYDGDTVVMVQDIKSGAGSSLPIGFKVVGNYLYFVANDGTNGLELWKYDGSTAVMVQDINSGAASGLFPQPFLTEIGSDLYFTGDDGTNGKALWKYDGDTAVMVRAINPIGNSNLSNLTALESELYFSADDGIHGSELWKYDGDTAVMVQDIRSGPDSSEPNRLTVFQSQLYFAADDGINPLTLWKSDGDTVIAVADDPSDFSDPNFMTVFQEKLYFTVNTGAFGSDLAAYDGTSISQLDLHPGPNASAASNFSVIGCNLYFEARDNDINGKELWVLSGANNGITQIGETLNANESGASYQWLECSNNNQPIAGATAQSFTPTKNGTYAVEITKGGCIAVSTCVNMTVVGLEDPSLSPIKVYPTISQGNITIDLVEILKDVSIKVRNLSGQVVSKHGPIGTTQRFNIDLPKSKGLYFIEVQTSTTEPKRFKVIRK